MKRPHLVHFLAITTDEFISINSLTALKENRITPQNELPIPGDKFPIQNIRLLNRGEYTLKIIGLDNERREIYRKTFESDSFGTLNFKIPLTSQTSQISALQIYEVGSNPGLELLLGTYIPITIPAPKKFIICDFDKTLVDTRYSGARDVYRSLMRPLAYFPTLDNSLELLQKHIHEHYHPFILSASPHFYEEAIRDWLYQHKIFTAGIFLKDYRKVFSFFDGELTPKDIKIQGLYKLNQLLDIVIMTGVPDDLVLMGDNFESDPLIYLTFALVLQEDIDPWRLWNTLKRHESFQLTKKQDSQTLNKIFQIRNMTLSKKRAGKGVVKLKIYIRKKLHEEDIHLSMEILRGKKDLISLYEGKKADSH